MKKQLTCLLLALFGQVLLAQAQFNKTFVHSIAGNSESVAPTDIIDGGNNETVTIGHNWNENLIVLRRLAFNGVVLLEKAYDVPLNFMPTKLIKTPNDEYIAVGHGNGNFGIKAYRFDHAFNILWAYTYDDNTYYPVEANGIFREVVNIVKVDDLTDDYIIVGVNGAEPAPPNPLGSTYPFRAIRAIRIDGTTGNKRWSQKYYHPANANAYDPPTPGHMMLRKELPSALAYGDNKYFIGGVALSTYHTNTNIMGPYEDKYTNFVMAIDGNGAIVNAYKEFTIPGNPSNPYNTKAPESYCFHDGIFDASTQEFVMSFTINGFKLANGTNKTEIGIVKFASNLGISDLKYYFDPSNPDHGAYKIKETYARDGYIVACGVNQYLTAAAMGPALLKVDKSGGVMFYHRYNNNHAFYQHQSFLSNPVITPILDANGTENYAMACTPIGVHTRVISTDVNGRACGFRVHSPEYEEPIDIITNVVNYITEDDLDAYAFMTYPDLPVIITNDDCSDYIHPDNYKPTTVTDIAINTARIYPTVLETGSNTVTIAANVDASTDILMSVSSIDGRTVETRRLALDRGNSKSSYTLPVSTPGIYMLKLTSNNTGLNQTIKILKQ